jgi:hypothetical protein
MIAGDAQVFAMKRWDWRVAETMLQYACSLNTLGVASFNVMREIVSAMTTNGGGAHATRVAKRKTRVARMCRNENANQTIAIEFFLGGAYIIMSCATRIATLISIDTRESDDSRIADSASSHAEFLFQHVVDGLRIGFSTGRFHHLADEPTE